MVTPYEIVLVEWADAHCSESGWITLSEYSDDGEIIVSSVGFLIKEGEIGAKKDHLTVWQTFCDGDVIHAMHIPLAMVRSIKVLTKHRHKD